MKETKMEIKKKEEAIKVSMNKASDDAMERMLKKVNENYQGGRVSKNDLVSWIVLWFEEKMFEKQIENIRTEFFDDLVYLELMLRNAKQARKEGQVVDNLLEQLVGKKSPSKKE